MIAAAIAVQGGGGIAAQLMQRHSPLVVVALRTAFSAAMLLVLRPPGRPRRAARAGAGSAEPHLGQPWGLAILLGLILAGMNTLFYVALSRIPMGVAVTLEFWGPLAVAVIASRRARDLAWVALAALGIYLLAGARLTADDALGVAAALGAGGCWAAFILVGGRLARAWPDGRGLTVSMVTGSLVIVPIALAAGSPGSLLQDPGVLAGGVLVALLSSTVPYTLELAALRRIASGAYGVLMSMEPGIAALVGFLLLGQALGWGDVAGIVAVAAASAGVSWASRRTAVVPGELEAA